MPAILYRSLALPPILLLGSCLLLSSDGPTYTFLAPDRRSEIRIEQYDCGFAGCALNFARLASQEGKVSVFVDGAYCGQIKTAFDIANWSNLNFTATEAWTRSAIVADYSVTPEELQASEGDVFRWAAYPGDGKPRRSVQEFQKRFTPKSSRTHPAHKTTPSPRPR